jgi:hypothetical protein
MKIVHRKRLPIKYLKDLCKLNSRAWDYNNANKNRSKLNYWLCVLGCVTDYINRRHNYICLAIDKGVCIGYLMAHVASKPKQFHPILFLIRIVVSFFLFLTKDGREILSWEKMNLWYLDKTVQIGKRILAGMDYRKISTGIAVAVDPEYRKSGVYKAMTKLLMNSITGYYIFYTSTESVYQAHEKMKYKKIYEVSCPYPKNEMTFIMYGDSSWFSFL